MLFRSQPFFPLHSLHHTSSSHFNANPIALKLSIVYYCCGKLEKNYDVQSTKILSESIRSEIFMECTVSVSVSVSLWDVLYLWLKFWRIKNAKFAILLLYFWATWKGHYHTVLAPKADKHCVKSHRRELAIHRNLAYLQVGCDMKGSNKQWWKPGNKRSLFWKWICKLNLCSSGRPAL